MSVNTIQDVNDMGCCCPFPECPGNTWQHNDRTNDYEGYPYIPWIQPTGTVSTDDVPTLYDGIDQVGGGFDGGYLETGSSTLYQGWYNNPTVPAEWAEWLQVFVFSPTGWELTFTGNVSEDPPTFADLTPFSDVTTGGLLDDAGEHILLYDIGGVPIFDFDGADDVNILVAGSNTVTEDILRLDDDTVQYATTESPASLQGTGGSTGLYSYSFDVAVEIWVEHTLNVPLTRTGQITATNAGLLLVAFSGITETDVPEASCVSVWPTVGSLAPWPVSGDYSFASPPLAPPEVDISVDVEGTRYKVGIPLDWQIANAAWSVWNLADPETRGEEPLGKRSVFECQWQEIFIPKAWQDYRDAHATYLSDKATWDAEDPETRGPEPVDAVEPEDPEDRPSLAADRDWNYGGPGTANYSDFFDMTQPTTDGKTRPMNMLIICYHATDIGVKPTSHGETIDLENPT